jgi:phage terminase large subunit
LSALAPLLPAAYLPLFTTPRRYKGAKGGRGGAKSHIIAERFVIEAATSHIRAACVREVQDSIRDSVKQLLEDKIEKYNLQSQFRITEREIVAPRFESSFIFRGLQNHTSTSIKSLERRNRVWYEEAQSLSKRSLDIATPTFRTDGTEQWFSWNPYKKDDPVDTFFRENEGDPDFCCVTVNYPDNPWFPDGLRRDMERDRIRNPEKYAHVWLGGYVTNSDAQVFRNWKVERFETPKDAVFYYGADWGFSIDPCVLVRCYIQGRKLYVDREVWKIGCNTDQAPAEFDKIDPEWSLLKARDPNWRSIARRSVITADSADPARIEYMKRQGFKRIQPSVKGANSVEEGVEFLASYDIVVHPDCRHVIDELTNYMFCVDKHTQQVLPKLEDKKNHTIDSLRYALEALRRSRGATSHEFRI